MILMSEDGHLRITVSFYVFAYQDHHHNHINHSQSAAFQELLLYEVGNSYQVVGVGKYL